MSRCSFSCSDRPTPSVVPLLSFHATPGFDVESIPKLERNPTVKLTIPEDQLLLAIHRLVDRLETSQALSPTITVPRRLAYSLEETAFLLGLADVGTVRSLIDRKLLKASRGLRHLRISHAEIERYLETTSD